MSRESRSRSRSPMEDQDGLEVNNGPRSRRLNSRKFENTRNSGKPVPSDCRVYVSNIPFEFKWQDLKDYCRSEVGNVAYVEMLNDDSGRPKGSAIVDFESADMAQAAIQKLHRMEVKGRKLIVKERDEIIHSRDFMFLFNKDNERGNRFSNNSEGRRNSGRPGNTFPDSGPRMTNFGNTYGLSVSFLESLGISGPLVPRVFVANLDYKVTAEDLEEVFKVAGKIVMVEVVKDLDGKSRGFGTVEYEHPLQAVQSISMLNNQLYYDRRMSVRLDKMSDKQKKEGSSSKLPRGLKGLGMGLGANGQAITDVSNFSSNPSMNPSGSVGSFPASSGLAMGGGGFSGSMPPNIGSIGGVNPNLSMLGLAALDSLQMNLGMNTGMGSGMSPGMGSGMNTGMGSGLNTGMGSGLNTGMGSGLNTGMGSGMNTGMGSGMNTGMNPSGSFGSQQNGSAAGAPMYNSGPNSGFGNNAVSSTDFNNQGYTNNKTVVQISNLPFDYTWKNLKDLCRNYGDIRFAEIKSKGIGWVRFATENEARRSADMLDGQRFDGRVLDASVV